MDHTGRGKGDWLLLPFKGQVTKIEHYFWSVKWSVLIEPRTPKEFSA